jgi:hypothetical protein
MSTPALQLDTLCVLDDRGRILSAREPGAVRPGSFLLVRSATACAWGLRSDIPDDLAAEVARLAGEEPPIPDLRTPPLHAARYLALLGGQASSGPAFEFPDVIAPPSGIMVVDDERRLARHFRGWVRGEIAVGRSPVMAVVEGGDPVSICFCARSTPLAAEAGVETAESFRGRGLAARVTAAWALAIRASGRIPLYSTSWQNTASLAVARKLSLIPYAADWSC